MEAIGGKGVAVVASALEAGLMLFIQLTPRGGATMLLDVGEARKWRVFGHMRHGMRWGGVGW